MPRVTLVRCGVLTALRASPVLAMMVPPRIVPPLRVPPAKNAVSRIFPVLSREPDKVRVPPVLFTVARLAAV